MENQQKNFDYATFFYKFFLLILISAQLFILCCEIVTPFTTALSLIILVYLVFRFYLLNRLGNKAKYLSLTLSQFLQKRENYDTKCKEQQSIKDDIKN